MELGLAIICVEELALLFGVGGGGLVLRLELGRILCGTVEGGGGAREVADGAAQERGGMSTKARERLAEAVQGWEELCLPGRSEDWGAEG